MKKILSLLLMLLMLFSFVACGKDDEESVTGTYDPLAGDSNAEGFEVNPDAWWQQYTTEPQVVSTTTKDGVVQTTKSSSKVTTNKSNSTDTKTTTKKSGSSANITTASSAPAKFTKVDSDTMQYNVKDGSTNGIATLTKAKSNKFVSESVSGVNSTFSTSYTNANVMCFSSTLPSMKGTDIVFVFSSKKKDSSTLQFVLQYQDGKSVAFGAMTIDSEQVPMCFWPCASSGNDEYTKYLDTFKTGYEKKAPGKYAEGTNFYKSLLSDECVKEFLTW